jgi:hypothetical protein
MVGVRGMITLGKGTSAYIVKRAASFYDNVMHPNVGNTNALILYWKYVQLIELGITS